MKYFHKSHIISLANNVILSILLHQFIISIIYVFILLIQPVHFLAKCNILNAMPLITKI